MTVSPQAGRCGVRNARSATKLPMTVSRDSDIRNLLNVAPSALAKQGIRSCLAGTERQCCWCAATVARRLLLLSQEPRLIPPGKPQSLAILQQHDVVTVKVRLHLFDRVDVYDAGA